MEAVKIQDSKTHETIQYRINGKRVSVHEYHEEVDRHLAQKRGCYNTSYIARTRSGNYKHVAHYSI